MTESAHDTPEADEATLVLEEAQRGGLSPRELAALQAMLAQILAELMAKHKATKRGEALALFTQVGQREVPELDGTALGTVSLEKGTVPGWKVTNPDALLQWVQANDAAALITTTTTSYEVGAAYQRQLLAAAKGGGEVVIEATGEVWAAEGIPGLSYVDYAPPKLVIRPDWDAAVPAVLAALGDAAALLGLEAPELEAAEASDRAELAESGS